MYIGFFVSEAVIRLFEILKMFYPPEGLCGAEPERGPIVFTLHFIGVGRGTGGFKIRIGNPPFWKPADVLFDGTDGNLVKLESSLLIFEIFSGINI